MLDHLGNFIATGDLGLHRAFLHTFLAMRAAEAQIARRAVLAMLVAIGDTAAQVAQDEGAGTTEGAELTLLLTRVTASTARAVNDLIADELERRLGQWGELRARDATGAIVTIGDATGGEPAACASPATPTSARCARRTRTR